MMGQNRLLSIHHPYFKLDYNQIKHPKLFMEQIHNPPVPFKKAE